MYAVAFDLVVADTEKHHPKGVTQAYGLSFLLSTMSSRGLNCRFDAK